MLLSAIGKDIQFDRIAINGYVSFVVLLLSLFDLAKHEFCGVVADTCQITDVFGRSSRLGDNIGEHHEDPGKQRSLGAFQRCPGGDRFLMTTVSALIDSSERAVFSYNSRVVGMTAL